MFRKIMEAMLSTPNQKEFKKSPDDERLTALADGEALGDVKKVISEIEKTIQNNPPTIGVIGVSGVGKSSTINSMFKTNLKTSATIRCTQEFSDHLVGAEIRRGPAEGNQAVLRVIDAPGLGEDIRQDPVYLKMYKENLPKCDVILWVMTARNRAIALDQRYLMELREFHDRMVFGVNQVDLVEPLDWNTDYNLPSSLQKERIEEIVADRKSRIEAVVGRSIKIVAYGAKQYYRLIELFEMTIEACPPERRWLFDVVRGVTPKDWLDRATALTEEEKMKIINKYAK